jgi:hypothetical protein
LAATEITVDHSHLPSELERVERLLACAPRPEPSLALRRLLLGEIHEELRHCVLHRLRAELLRGQRRASRRLAAACATALLLVVGLSAGIMHAAGVPLKPPASAPSVVDVAWQLQQLSPQLSEKDSLLQAALRHVGPDAACGDVLKNLFTDTKSQDREKGTGTFCAQHPKGRSGKRRLSPFPPFPAPKSHDR